MWWGTEGFSAKECQAALCQLTDPVSSLLSCCRPYLVTIRHGGAKEPCGPSTYTQAGRQAGSHCPRWQGKIKWEIIFIQVTSLSEFNKIVQAGVCTGVNQRLLYFNWEENLLTCHLFAYLETVICNMQRVAIQINKWENRKRVCSQSDLITQRVMNAAVSGGRKQAFRL